MLTEQQRKRRAKSVADWIKSNRLALEGVARRSAEDLGRGVVVILARDGGGTKLAYTTMRSVHQIVLSHDGLLTLAALVKTYEPSSEFVVFSHYPEGDYFAAKVKYGDDVRAIEEDQ